MYSYYTADSKSNSFRSDQSLSHNKAITNTLIASTAIPAATNMQDKSTFIPEISNRSSQQFLHRHNAPSILFSSNSSVSSYSSDSITQSHEGRLIPLPLVLSLSDPKLEYSNLKYVSKYSVPLPGEHSRISTKTGAAKLKTKSIASIPARPLLKGYPGHFEEYKEEEKTEDDWSVDISSGSSCSKYKRIATPADCSNPGECANLIVEENYASDWKLPAKTASTFEYQNELIAEQDLDCLDDKSILSDLTSSTHHHICPHPEVFSQSGSVDNYMEVYPGLSVPFRGSSETMQAIYEDKFSPNWCYLCNETIFCIQDADYVLCPLCKVIAPAEVITRKSMNHRGGVGIGFTMAILSDAMANRGDRTNY